MRRIIPANLWSRYGQEELTTAIQVVEKACNDDAAAISCESAVNQGEYETQVAFVEKLDQDAVKA